MVTEKDVLARWESIQGDEERVLFIVGGPGSGKSELMRKIAEEKGWVYLEAKSLLSEAILEMPAEQRANFLKERIIDACGNDRKPILMDSVQVFFDPLFHVEPVKLCKEISQIHPLIVGWRGRFVDDVLHLEYHNDPEFFTYKVTHTNHVIELGK